jgi:hemoglobin-like flavoprotein
MVEKLAGNHSRRGIEHKHFENLGIVLIDILIEKLGDKVMNEQAQNAWKKAYLVLLDLIDNGLKSYE